MVTPSIELTHLDEGCMADFRNPAMCDQIDELEIANDLPLEVKPIQFGVSKQI